MAMNIGDLEVVIGANIQSFQDGIKKVSSSIDGVATKMGQMNRGGGALSVAAGNIISSVVKGAVNFGKDILSQAVDVSAYNQKVSLGLETVIAGEIRAESAIHKRVVASSKVISVDQQVAAATTLTGKALKAQQKVLNDAANASDKLNLANAKLALAQGKLNEIPPPKKYSDNLKGLYNNVRVASIEAQGTAIDKLNAKVAAGAAIQEQQNAIVAKYTAMGPRVVTTYKDIIVGYAVSEEEAAKQAAERTTNLINQLEQIAVKSPFNKENVINAFSTLKKFAGLSTETAVKYTQGVADIASVMKPEGPVLENFAKTIGKVNAYKRAMMGDVNQMTQLLGKPFQDKLEKAMGTDAPGLRKMIRKGLVTADIINPILEGFFEEYKDKAKQFSETLPGLIESIGDVKRNVLGDFFTPILNGAIPAMAFLVDTFTDSRVREKLRKFGGTIGKAISDGILKAGRVIAEVLTKLGILDNKDPILERFFKFTPDSGTMNSITNISNKIVDVVNFLKNHAETIKTILGGIATAFASLAVVGPVLNAIKTVGFVLTGLASPIGVISLLIAGAVLAWTTNFGGFRDIVTNVWNTIEGPLGKFVGALQGIGWALQNGVGFKDAFTGAMSGLIKPEILSQFDPLLGIPDKIKQAWDGKLSVSNLISGVAVDISGFIANIAAQFGAVDSKILGKGLGDLMTKAVGGLADIVNEPVNKTNLENFAKNVGTTLGNIVGGVGNFFHEFLVGLGLLPAKVTDKELKPGAETFMGNLGRLLSSLIPTLVSGFAQGLADGIAQSTLEGNDLPLTIARNASSTNAQQLGGLGKAAMPFSPKIFGTNDMINEVYGEFRLHPKISSVNLSDMGIKETDLWKDEDIKKVFPTAFKESNGDWIIGNPLTFSKEVKAALVPDTNAPTEDVTSKYIEAIASGELSEVMLKSIGVVKLNGHYYTNNGRGIVVETPVSSAVVPAPNTNTATPTFGPSAFGGSANDPFGFAKSLPGVTMTSATTATVPAVAIQQPVTFTPTVATTATTSTTAGAVTTVAEAQTNWANQEGLKPAAGSAPAASATAAGTAYTAPPMNVQVPVTMTPTFTAPTGTTDVNAGMIQAWAKSQGLVLKGTSYESAYGVVVSVPVTVRADTKSRTDSVIQDASVSSGAPDFIESYFRSMGFYWKDNKYVNDFAVTVSMPIIVQPTFQQSTSSGSTGGGSDGGNNAIGSGLAQALVDSINGDASVIRVSGAITNLIKGALNLSKVGLGLEPVSPASPGFAMGKLIADSVGQGMSDGIGVVNTALETIGTKFNDLRLNQIEPTAASLNSLSKATLIDFVGPNMDTFRLSYLVPLNSEFARMDSLLGSILTKLGMLGQAAKNASNVPIPSVGDVGGANTNTNLPPPSDKGANFNVTTVLDGQAVGQASFTYANGKIVEETKRYG